MSLFYTCLSLRNAHNHNVLSKVFTKYRYILMIFKVCCKCCVQASTCLCWYDCCVRACVVSLSVCVWTLSVASSFHDIYIYLIIYINNKSNLILPGPMATGHFSVPCIFLFCLSVVYSFNQSCVGSSFQIRWITKQIHKIDVPCSAFKRLTFQDLVSHF